MIETNTDANINNGDADNDEASSIDASNKAWSCSSASSTSEITVSTICRVMDDCAVGRDSALSATIKQRSNNSKLIDALNLIFGGDSTSSLQSDDSFFSHGTEWLNRPDSVVLADQRGVSRVSSSHDLSIEDSPISIVIEESIAHALHDDNFLDNLSDVIEHFDHEFQDRDSISIAKRRLGGDTKAKNLLVVTDEEEEGEVYDGNELIVPWPSSRSSPDVF